MKKKCINCFKLKPLAQFYRKLTSWQSRCKSCNTEVCKGYRMRKSGKLEKHPLDWWGA